MVLASLWTILGTPLLCPSGLIPCCEPAAVGGLSDGGCDGAGPLGDCECPCKSPTPTDECPTCTVTCAPLTMLDAGPSRPCLEPTCQSILWPVDGLALFTGPIVRSPCDPFSSGGPPGALSAGLPLLI